MNLNHVREWLRSIAFDGVYRPADDSVIAPIMTIPFPLNNTGTEIVLEGPGGTAFLDENIAEFMPATARYFICLQAYQFTFPQSPTLDPAQQLGIAKVATQSALRHAPLVGQKAYRYRSVPGFQFDHTITAISTDITEHTALQSGYTSGSPTKLADWLAIDMANDRLRIEIPTVAAIGGGGDLIARLDLYGFALSYDGRPQIEQLIREQGPAAYLQRKSQKRNLGSTLARAVEKVHGTGR